MGLKDLLLRRKAHTGFEKINIGGGPNFSHPDWLNIEEVASETNTNPITLDPTTRLPCDDGSVSLAYTSHTLEHLDDATNDRVLDETMRCLRRDGDLVIKVPDFEATIEAWRNKDADFLSNKNWGYDAVTWSWPAKGVADNLTSRASLIFSGYWNKEYGQHFAHQINRTPTSYFGPAVVSEDEVERLFTTRSPREISHTLAGHIRRQEPPGFTYTHQNGWSREEMYAFLRRHNFEPSSDGKEAICSRFHDIPGIRDMFAVSMYVHARPRKPRFGFGFARN